MLQFSPDAPGARAFSLAAAGIVGVLVMLILGPIVFSEGTRDWTTYQDAADRLANGAPLYLVESDLLYIYPPPLAAIWALGLTPGLLLVGKVVALAALVPIIGWPLGVPVVVLLALVPSLHHDVVLGNVMVFFAVALTWSALRPGRAGSIALGALAAIAAKPVLGPYLLWLLLVRRRDFAWTIGSAALISVVFAAAIGPGRYVEYLVALPRAGQYAAAWPGNLGLSAISPVIGVLGVVAAYLIAVVAARRGEQGLPIVIGALMLAQPSYGVAYGLLLLPAVIWFWHRRPLIGLALATVLPAFLAIASAPLAGAIVSLLGVASGESEDGFEVPRLMASEERSDA